MKKILIFISLSILFIAFTAHGANKRDKRTPFAKVEFRDNAPYVTYNGKWVKLVSIQEKPVSDFVDYVKNGEPCDWQFTFCRYLHYVMDDMNMVRGESVKVSFLENGKEVTRDFPLKKENRELATSYYYKKLGDNRFKREHTNIIPQNLKYLNARIDGYNPTSDNWITPEMATHDLEYLEWEIINNYSYANLKGFDYSLALDAICADLKQGITKRDFALQLKMFMANFGDGHSRISLRELMVNPKDKYGLPFQIVKDGSKFYAVSGESKNFFNDDYPQIVSVNGISIDKLYTVAERFIPKTTTKFVERNTVNYMNLTQLMLRVMGCGDLDKVVVGFSDGLKKIDEDLALVKRSKYVGPKRYHFKSELIDNNIGYLAFQKHMDSSDNFIDSLHKSMTNFENTNGLIIDIRGNGGGSRAPLKALLPYFIKKPKVVNVARYRIDANKDICPPNGYLEARYSYPANYEDYNMKEQQCIRKFKKHFVPKLTVPNHKFTNFHYMVVSPNDENGTYYYDRPVVVLVDEGCFSASDIFAAGIKQGDNVTLLGNITGGGSGFSSKKYLPNSHIKVKLSRMFSYQPNGTIYDGHGVIPNVIVDYTLNDKLGKSDSQLTQAVELVEKSTR